RAVAHRVPAARLPDAQPGPDADQEAAARQRLGLGVRGAVPGTRDVRQLPAPQARPARAAADPHPARGRLQPAVPVKGVPGRARLARRSLSLRARLLTGLIALTAMFLVVMGVVTTVVLGTLERNQLNGEVRLASRQSLVSLQAGTDGFSAVYLSLDSGR